MRLREDTEGACIEFADPAPRSPGEIRPIARRGLRPSASTVVVFIVGRPYAAFHTRRDAYDAISLWRGDVDGWGRLVKTHYGAHWPAIQGKRVSVEGGLHEYLPAEAERRAS